LWVEKIDRRFRMEDDEEVLVLVQMSASTTLNGDRLGTAGCGEEVVECRLVTDVRFDGIIDAAEKTSETWEVCESSLAEEMERLCHHALCSVEVP